VGNVRCVGGPAFVLHGLGCGCGGESDRRSVAGAHAGSQAQGDSEVGRFAAGGRLDCFALLAAVSNVAPQARQGSLHAGRDPQLTWPIMCSAASMADIEAHGSHAAFSTGGYCPIPLKRLGRSEAGIVPGPTGRSLKALGRPIVKQSHSYAGPPRAGADVADVGSRGCNSSADGSFFNRMREMFSGLPQNPWGGQAQVQVRTPTPAARRVDWYGPMDALICGTALVLRAMRTRDR
jgi:hypothetical protein